MHVQTDLNLCCMLMPEGTRWQVHPLKTQISLRRLIKVFDWCSMGSYCQRFNFFFNTVLVHLQKLIGTLWEVKGSTFFNTVLVHLQKLIEKLKPEKEEDQHDAFILVILSYGGNGTVICTDGKEIPLSDIIQISPMTAVGMLAHQRLRSAYASAQSDQRL